MTNEKMTLYIVIPDDVLKKKGVKKASVFTDVEETIEFAFKTLEGHATVIKSSQNDILWCGLAFKEDGAKKIKELL